MSKNDNDKQLQAKATQFQQFQSETNYLKRLEPAARKLQAEVDQTEFVGQSQDNLVQVVVDGCKQPIRVILPSEAISLEASVLSNLIAEAWRNTCHLSEGSYQIRWKNLFTDSGLMREVGLEGLEPEHRCNRHCDVE